MSCSDYLAVKKQKYDFKNKNNTRYSSQLTKNKEYCNLQNINIVNEDGDLLQKKRFNISLCNNKKIYSKYNNTLASGFSSMFSIPKIHTPVYIKNQYQPPFCWTCWTPLGEITHSIACSVCDFNNEMQMIEQDAITSAYENAEQEQPNANFTEYLDQLLNDFDNAQDNPDVLFDFSCLQEGLFVEQEKKDFVDTENICEIIHDFENSSIF
jgi:hypothetical protein